MRTVFFLIAFSLGAAEGQNLTPATQDVQQLLTATNIATAAAGLGLAGLAHPWDGQVRSEFIHSSLFKKPASLTNIYGSSQFNLPVAIGIWSLGALATAPHLRTTGSALLRTLILTQMVVGPIKLAVHRKRPDGSNRLSFPSGHTANSFAIARLLHSRYGLRTGLPLYAVGATVAIGRMQSDRHYLSDVLMGAALGTAVGNAVIFEQRSGAFKVSPHVDWKRQLLGIEIKF